MDEAASRPQVSRIPFVAAVLAGSILASRVLGYAREMARIDVQDTVGAQFLHGAPVPGAARRGPRDRGPREDRGGDDQHREDPLSALSPG